LSPSQTLSPKATERHRASWVLDLLLRGACGCGCWRPGGASAGGASAGGAVHITRTAAFKQQ